MHTIEVHVDIPLAAHDVYSQATQFQALPTFLRDVETARQVDDTHLRLEFRRLDHLTTVEFEITEQIPDKRIAWTSSGQPGGSGCFTFHRLDEHLCRIMVQIGLPGDDADHDDEQTERVRQAVVENLDDFRNFLVGRGKPTGRWSGLVTSPDEREHGAGGD